MNDTVFVPSKRIAVRIVLPGREAKTIYGVGKDKGDALAVECDGFAFHFEKEFWDEFELRLKSI